MIPHRVQDWDDAYANAKNIAGGAGWEASWAESARSYRAESSRSGRMR